MRRPIVLLATLASLGTVVGDASAACATAHMIVFFDAFPAEAASRPLYWKVEGTGGTNSVPFRVQLFGGDCGGSPVSVSYRTDPGTATPAADYVHEQDEAVFLNTGAHVDFKDDAVSVTPDASPDGAPPAAIESATLVLYDAKGGVGLGRPSSASVVIVDDDGTPRTAALDGDYPHLESRSDGGIPVFRGGDLTLAPSVSVSYAIAPDPANPATLGEDYQAAASGTLEFNGDDRVQMIPITVIADA
ncbi:MAG: DUF3876 domain-containing protein, partial [Actinomycetota bacterium]|nr:DUF3876 domain-containing protein [Actinomycetota bacterium]